MLKLCDIGPWNVHERSVCVDIAVVGQGSHRKLVILDAYTFEIALSEYKAPKVLVDRSQQHLGRRWKTGRADMLITTIAIDADVFSQVCTTRGSESLYGEDIALLHTLSRRSLHKRHLLISMNFVAKYVMSCDSSHRLNRNGLTPDLNFIAFHHFLHHCAHVIDPSVYTSFLTRV